MKETLKYIGRWVIRFILMSIIFSTFQSCAKALSSQDIIDYVDNTANYFSNNSNYQIIKNYINNSVAAKNWLSQYANEYNNFAIRTSYYQGAQTYTLKLFSSNNGKIQSNNNGLSYTGNYRQTLFRGNNQTNNFASIDNNASIDGGYCYSSNSNYENNLTGMAFITDEIVGTLPKTFVGNQAIPQFVYLEFLNTMDDAAYNGNLYTYYYKGDFYSNNQIKLGDIIPHDSYYFEVRLKDSKTEIIKGTSFVALNTTPYNFYNDGAIYINENYEVYAIPRLLNYSKQYQLEIISYYGEGNNNLFEDIDWFIFLPYNASISGDIITNLGSGDFTTQDSTNQIIDNNNNFFDNLYNKMFTISGDQVNEIINTTMSNVQIPSGEIAEIEQVFNYISGEHGDFVISWTDKTTHFTVNGANISQITIPAKQINFSEMERQSPELQQAMHWARLITNISIFSILIHEAYICLLATLGVPVAIYGQKLEEKQQLAAQQQKQEQAWQNRLEQQRYNEWLYSHRKR